MTVGFSKFSSTLDLERISQDLIGNNVILTESGLANVYSEFIPKSWRIEISI